MRYPSFIEEMDRDENRPKLWAGVWSGYAIAIGFGLLALGAVLFDMSPYGRAFALMVAIKVVTNTATLVALRRDRWAIDLMTLNITADVLLMTAVLYYTGGPGSPLLAIYVIEVTVMALLSNLGVTLLVAAGILASYGTMATLVVTGELPTTAAPALQPAAGLQVVVYVGLAAFAIGVPTLFTTLILRRMRAQEAALQARTAELIEAGKQRSVFLASVTHELRTPIHGVQGLSDLIASGVYGPATERQQQACAAIKRSAQGLLGLIDDLLALVRADVGRLDVRVGDVELDELIEQVVASVQWMLGTKKLTLGTEVAPVAGGVVSDRRLLGHILVNLVANAAKFTPEGGRVTVRARGEGDRLILEVADTGIGIPDDRREAIFEAFRQLDGSDERHYGGVGLGLTLVRRLVDLLGGTIELVSAVGKGSTFTVRLPARITDPDEEPTIQRPRAATATGEADAVATGAAT
ncbi:MAG: HAMP domain-containing histidine kinase, partial [Myxococcales bacterium]|nr:HAMP domain-containing histidine kinase [Myxococcales bacterium]